MATPTSTATATTAEPDFNPAALPRMAQQAEQEAVPQRKAPTPPAAVPQPQSAIPTPGGPLTPASPFSPPISTGAGGYMPTGYRYTAPLSSPYAEAPAGPYQRKSGEVHPSGYVQHTEELEERQEEEEAGWLKWLKEWVDGVNDKFFGWMGGKAA
jgi:hypothetical protein